MVLNYTCIGNLIIKIVQIPRTISNYYPISNKLSKQTIFYQSISVIRIVLKIYRKASLRVLCETKKVKRRNSQTYFDGNRTFKT